MMTGYDLNKLQQQVNQNLALIENWLRYKLSLNYNKTIYLLFTKKDKIENSNFNVSINKIEIKRSDYVKYLGEYLGVYIDDKMNWSYHINHLTQHLRKSIGLICKNIMLMKKPQECYTMLLSILIFNMA